MFVSQGHAQVWREGSLAQFGSEDEQLGLNYDLDLQGRRRCPGELGGSGVA